MLFIKLLLNKNIMLKENINEKYNEGNENAICGYGNTSPLRPFTERTFSKVEAGSLRASIFAMSSLALGTAC